MVVKLANEVVLVTKHEVIREKDLVELIHKDGRPIRGRLNDIKDEMLYIGENDVVHLGQIESIYKAKVI